MIVCLVLLSAKGMGSKVMESLIKLVEAYKHVSGRHRIKLTLDSTEDGWVLDVDNIMEARGDTVEDLEKDLRESWDEWLALRIRINGQEIIALREEAANTEKRIAKFSDLNNSCTKVIEELRSGRDVLTAINRIVN